MNLLERTKAFLSKPVSKGLDLKLTQHDRNVIWQFLGGWMPLNFQNNFVNQINAGYTQNVDIYSIVKKIIDSSKSVPWIIEKKQSNGNYKILQNTTLHELIDAPNNNKGYTWNDIEEQTLLYLLITGNTYLVGNTQFNSSLIEELDILPTQAVNILNKNSDFFMPNLEYQFSFGSSARIYQRKELCHIKYFNPNLERYYYGLSPIQVAADVVQVGNERWTADASILGNRGITGIVGDKSQLPMTNEEAKLADDSIKSRIGGADKFGGIIVTNKDLTYTNIALSSADLELLKKGVITLRTLCNVLGVDSGLFNDSENQKYANKLEAQKALFTNCIIPLSDKMSEAYTSFLCKNHFPNENVRMRQDFSKVECLQENFQQKADILGGLKDKGIYTANEVREQMNMPKSTDPNADLLIINTTPLNNLQNSQQTTN
jgi:HK97 family phage portal protein